MWSCRFEPCQRTAINAVELRRRHEGQKHWSRWEKARLCQRHVAALAGRPARWKRYPGWIYQMRRIKAHDAMVPKSAKKPVPTKRTVQRAARGTTKVPVGPAYKRFGKTTPVHGYRRDAARRFGDGDTP